MRFCGFFESAAGPLAVAGETLLEVIERPALSRLPLAPPCCLGVFPFRGQLVVGLGHDCFGDAARGAAGELMMICATDSGMVGLPIQKVVRIVHQDGNRPFVSEAAGGERPRGWLGDYPFEGRDFALIDVDQLLEQIPRP